MVVRWVTGFLDTPSRVAEPFWQAVTDSGLSARRGPGGAFATLLPACGDAYLRVQVVGDGPARAHLDLHVEQVAAQARRAVGLGASVVLDEGSLVVLRSPVGLPFCLVEWAGEAVRPVGGRSLVDQLCLEVPAGAFDTFGAFDAFDVEVAFWAAMTGWERPPGAAFLVRPGGMPLGLVLRRVDGPAGMHLGLACGDRVAEVAWHVSLGAEVVAVHERWTTLRDPAGRAYCVTDRPV